ncbi:hypothetical protein B296_00043460 [Ensete ventricosum]|uniref:SLIDE domain-containing protein n=1 Tax=Ensete ventricosum TaxID=4639 RepID=A0A426ZED9_ENSVE|nr:hypothetical protein B296_00043460 [Ensete ventricosum]
MQFTIEEKVIERAYKKLALDALVIQQGRLAEQKSMFFAKIFCFPLMMRSCMTLMMRRYNLSHNDSAHGNLVTRNLITSSKLFVKVVQQNPRNHEFLHTHQKNQLKDTIPDGDESEDLGDPLTTEEQEEKEQLLEELCMIHKLGYGNWDELKAAFRTSPLFRFDWFVKSRTTQELARRCDTLIRLVEKENQEYDERERQSRKDKKLAKV